MANQVSGGPGSLNGGFSGVKPVGPEPFVPGGTIYPLPITGQPINGGYPATPAPVVNPSAPSPAPAMGPGAPLSLSTVVIMGVILFSVFK